MAWLTPRLCHSASETRYCGLEQCGTHSVPPAASHRPEGGVRWYSTARVDGGQPLPSQRKLSQLTDCNGQPRTTRISSEINFFLLHFYQLQVRQFTGVGRRHGAAGRFRRRRRLRVAQLLQLFLQCRHPHLQKKGITLKEGFSSWKLPGVQFSFRISF